VLLIGGVAALSLLVAGCAWKLHPTKASNDEPALDARYLPDGCNAIARIKVSELLNSPAGMSVLQQVVGAVASARSTASQRGRQTGPATPADTWARIDGAIGKDLGLDLLNIREAMLARAPGDWRPISIVHTYKSVKPNEVLERLPRNPFFSLDTGKPVKDADPIQVGARWISEKSGTAFVIPEDKVVVYGSTKALRAILERDASTNLPAELTETMARLAGKSTVEVAFALAKSGEEKTPTAAAVTLPSAGTLTIQFSDEINARCDVTFEAESQAAKAMSTLRSFLASAQSVPGDVGKLIHNVEASQSGSGLTITAKAERDAIAGIADPVLLGQLLRDVFDKFQIQPPRTTFVGRSGKVSTSATDSKSKASSPGR
jgi:hypothetical protein